MKKLLLSFVVLLASYISMAQPCDYHTGFNENFDGTTIGMQSSTGFSTGDATDWSQVTTLYVSAPGSYHSNVYGSQGLSYAWTNAVAIDYTHRYVYLDFDHICKVHQYDQALISIQRGTDNGSGNISWTSPVDLETSTGDATYYGSATNLSGGYYNHSIYGNAWNPTTLNAQPTNLWWKHEMIDISQYVYSSGSTFTHFRLRFSTNKLSPTGSGTETVAGWYLDNIKTTSSLTELIPPTITLQTPVYQNRNNNCRNNTGPYTVKARLIDNDTIQLDSIRFFYLEDFGGVTSTDTIYLSKEILSNSFSGGKNTVDCQWVIPSQCYETTVRYQVYTRDSHCSNTALSTSFTPYTTQTGLFNNDCEMHAIVELPTIFKTDTLYDLKVDICNRAKADSVNPNLMTSVLIGWSVNGIVQTPHQWTGALCLDQCATSVNVGQFRAVRDTNFIKVWVMNRNGRADDKHSNDTLTYDGFACDSAMEGSYVLGTAPSDFETMPWLHERFNRCGLKGHVTINIKDGNYGNFSFKRMYTGQGRDASISFVGIGDNARIIDNGDDGSAITLTGVSYLNFQNLKIEGKDIEAAYGGYSRGVYFTGAVSHNINVSNCFFNIHSIPGTSTSYVAVSRIAAPASGNTGDTALTFRNNIIMGGTHGFYFLGTSARRNGNINIINNEITTCYKGIYGIYSNIINCDDNKIAANTVTQDPFTGIDIQYSVKCQSLSRNSVYSPVNTLNGISLKNYEGTAIAENSRATVANNMVYATITDDGKYGLFFTATKYTNFYHNSIYITSVNPFNNTAAIFHQTGSTGINIKGNIFYNASPSTLDKNYAIYFNAIPATYSSDYNNYYSVGNVIGFSTVSRGNLDEWRTAVGASHSDTNTISLPLEFPSSIDNSFHTHILVPSSYNGLECPTYDSQTFFQAVRNPAITHMGYASEPIAHTDLTALCLTSPIFGTECPQDTVKLSYSFKNVGTDTLNLSELFRTNPVRHQCVLRSYQGTTLLSTVTMTSTSLSDIIGTVAGQDVIIRPLERKTLEFGNIRIEPNVRYEYAINVRVNNDINYSNDTIRGEFEKKSIKPYFEEIFSAIPNPEWTIEQINGAGNWSYQMGEGVDPVIAPQYGLGRLFFNSKNFATNVSSRAITPVADLARSTNPVLEFWYAHDNAQSSKQDGITISISSDGGVTYTQAMPLLKRYNATFTTPGWMKYVIPLSTYTTSSCAIIAFDAVSKAGGNINIDRVRIRSVFENDIAVNTLYTLGENATAYAIGRSVQATISNEGSTTQTNVPVVLSITGANSYRDTLIIPSIQNNNTFDASVTVRFDSILLPNSGINYVTVSVPADDFVNNDSVQWRMVTTHNQACYADQKVVGGVGTDYYTTQIGTTTSTQYAVRYNVNEDLIATSVKAYIVNAADAVGKRFRCFIANAEGTITATSNDTVITNDMIETWVSLPINNYALTNVSDYFYAGVEMIDAGYYLGLQEETPLRDSTYYILNSNGTVTPITCGRIMIGVGVDRPVYNELALLSLVNPVTNCDLGHEHIIVEITNNGSRDILPGSVFHYSVNGLQTVTETCLDTIFSHEVRNYEFDTVFDFNNALIGYDSNYAITVWIDSLYYDRIRFNDTLTASITSLGKAVAPIVTADTVYIHYHSRASLSAVRPPESSESIFSWYTNAGFETWFYQYQGDVFVTPIIYFDTTFYVNLAPGTIYDNIVGNGNLSTTYPFVFSSGYSRGRMLYLQNEIGSFGPINKIGIYVSSVAGGDIGIPIKLYIKQTDMTIFPTPSAINWDDETTNAVLIYDGQLYYNTVGWHYFYLPIPFEYTSGNIEILTETNCGDFGANNCGVVVSGSNVYPYFYSSNPGQGYVQYKNGNSYPFSGNYTSPSASVSRRLNMSFEITDLECPSEKAPIEVIVVDRPSYDIGATEVLYPETACTLGDENIVVKVKNYLNIPVPANKVLLVAKFNGDTVTHLIDEEFGPTEEKTITFARHFNFRAPNASITFNGFVTANLLNESTVYRNNDTAYYSFISKHTDVLLSEYNYEGNYTQTFIVKPDNHAVFNFYNHADDATSFYSGSSYTTPILYDTVTYWVSAITAGTNCETERSQVNVNVGVPTHDLITKEFLEPASYQCGVIDAHLKIKVGNTSPDSTTIPANTFSLTGNFTGTSSSTVSHTISQPIGINDAEITFTNTAPIGSTTQNNILNYVVYSNPVNTSMYVYRLNDSIRGSIKVPATPSAPAAITTSVTYNQPYTVTPSQNVLNYYYFYKNSTDSVSFAEGNSFTTAPIVENPTTFYYSGRISDETNFAYSISLGTQSVSTAYPFNFANGHSVGAILYTSAELGANAGIIDTIYLQIKVSNIGEIPIKFYLKNTTSTTLAQGTYQWSSFVNGAKLIYDKGTSFDEVGWFAIPVPGGFKYEGNNLLLLTEHNCGDASCSSSMGISPYPAFNSSSITGRVLYASDNSEISFALFRSDNKRINTKFKFSYTCQSPKSLIRLNTVIPTKDIAVERIVKPITPNNNYTNNEQVTIRIKNYGNQSASGFTVGYQLAGSAAVVETYNGAAIATGNTGTYTFATHLDLSDIYFSKDFMVFVNMTNDNYNNNDTLKTTVSKPSPCYSRADNQIQACISKVNFAGINNGPGAPIFNFDITPNDGRYTDYTATVEPGYIIQGQFYPLTITNSFTDNTGRRLYKYAYIDFNGDNVFSADERVLPPTGTVVVPSNAPSRTDSSLATTRHYVDIPNNAAIGITRMRVICSQASVTDACTIYPYGETEDYAVSIGQPFLNDLGVIGYYHPIGDKVCADGDGKIKVYIKNYGTEAQIFSDNNRLILTVQVQGPVPGTYTTTVSSGSLASGATMVAVFDHVDYSILGTYSLTTSLSYQPDQYNVNDEFTIETTVNEDVHPFPISENFENGIPASWKVVTTRSSYKWETMVGPGNHVPNAGPSYDHTLGASTYNGQFVIVEGYNQNTSAITTMTTGCVDLHYTDGYPIVVSYFKHIYSRTCDSLRFYVEAGASENFEVVDTIFHRTQNSSTAPWTKTSSVFTYFDEVARVRFKMVKAPGLIDAALDDILFQDGKPDIGIDTVLYPSNFFDEDAVCEIQGDSIHPIIIIKNFGITPIEHFSIIGRMKIGNEFEEHTEVWDGYLRAGEQITYTFENNFKIPRYAAFDFETVTTIDNDEEPLNNQYTINGCAIREDGIDSYEIKNGVVLNQNVPNPANNQTRITFLVPEPGTASMSIYSTTGQLLYNEEMNVSFGENHIDIQTHSLSDGIYFYTLQFKDVVMTKKMIINR